MVLVFMAKAISAEAVNADVDRSYALSLTQDVASAARPWIPEANRQMVDDTLGLQARAEQH
jgi:hypothetical protein